MQHRMRSKDSVQVINDNLDEWKYAKLPHDEHSNCSDEYEEETHVSYNFRRWANHIWSVSNNITNRLRDLIGHSNPSFNTTSNHCNLGANYQADRNTTRWSSPGDVIGASNPINDGADCVYLRNRESYSTGKNHRRYGQRFGFVTTHRRRNGVEVPLNSAMGHGVSNYSPVLILPRINHGANRYSIHSGVYQAQQHMFRYPNMQGEPIRNGWYQHYHGQWGCEGSCGANDYSTLSDRHGVPDKLGFSMKNSKIKKWKRKKEPRDRKRKITYDDCDTRSVKHFGNRADDHRTESHRHGLKSVFPVDDTGRSREESFSRSLMFRNYEGDNSLRWNSDQCLETGGHSKPKKVVWDLEPADITSQENNSSNSSTNVFSAKSSVTLFVEKKKASVNRYARSNLEHQDNTDESRKPDITSIFINDMNADENQQSVSNAARQSRCSNFAGKANIEKQNDESVDGTSMNTVDSLLASLRERTETLADICSLDLGVKSGPMHQTRTENVNLTKDRIVASCLAGSYFPQFFENKENNTFDHSVTNVEDVRPSFSDRIQDIWKDGKAISWRSSLGHDTSTKYNFESEKNPFSKLSALGSNRQSVLPQHLGEYNNAVTLARILQRLHEAKPKSPKHLCRDTRKESKTCVRVDVGVQKSTKNKNTSTTFLQHSDSTEHLVKKRRRRSSYRKKSKTRASEFPVQTPRPLQVFSGQSISPTSSIQFASDIQPLPNFNEFSSSPVPVYARSFSKSYTDPSDTHAHSTTITCNPIVQKSVVEMGSKCTSVTSDRDSASTRKKSHLVSRNMDSFDDQKRSRPPLTKQEQIFSTDVLRKVEQEQQAEGYQLHEFHHSKSARLQRSGKVDAASETVFPKSHCWWKRTFRFDKSRNLGRKMTSFLRYVSKKHSGHDFAAQKDAFEKALTEIVVPVSPVPPVRRRRRRRSSKSVQWDLDKEVRQSIEKIDSSQVTENQSSNKSTSVCQKVTVNSGTNTVSKNTHKMRAESSPKQNETVSFNPETMRPSRIDLTDTSIKSLTSDQLLMDSDIVSDGNEKSESLFTGIKSRSNDCPRSSEEDFEPCREESNELKKFQVPRSFSSKIPLATKVATVLRQRPSTAPILESLRSSSSQSNTLIEESEAGESCSTVCSKPETAKRSVFKHNRSSLLRVSKGMSKKSATGQYSISRKITGGKDVERSLIPTSLTFGKRRNLAKSRLVGDRTRCEELDLRSNLEMHQNDTKMRSESSVNTETSNSLNIFPISSNSEDETRPSAAAGKISFCDLFKVFLSTSPDSTSIPEPPIPLPMSRCGEPIKHSFEEKNINVSGADSSFCRNSEKSMNEQRPLKAFVTAKGKKAPVTKLESGKLCDKENVIHGSELSMRARGCSEDRWIESNDEEKTSSEKDGNISIFNDRKATNVSRIRNRKFAKLSNLCKTQEENTKHNNISEVIRVLIDAVIDQSVNMNKRNKSLMVPCGKIVRQCISENSEKSSEISVDLLAPILTQIRTVTPSSFEEETFHTVSHNLDESITDGIRCSQKPSKHMANEICNVLDTNIASHARREEGQFAPRRSKIPRSHSAIKTINYGDNKLKVACKMRGRNLFSDGNCGDRTVPMKMMKMEHYFTQSIVTINLLEIGDRVRKLGTSMCNAQLKSSTKIVDSKSEGRNMVEKEMTKNGGSSDTDSNSGIIDDENNSRSSIGDTNVKIDNKVLEEKVKHSIENGVPLKTIVITDPSIIEPNCFGKCCVMMDEMNRDEGIERKEFKKHKELFGKLRIYNNVQNCLANNKSEGQCSHTTCASHENRQINVINKLGNPESANSRTQRGSLIPRYKATIVLSGKNKINETSKSRINDKVKER